MQLLLVWISQCYHCWLPLPQNNKTLNKHHSHPHSAPHHKITCNMCFQRRSILFQVEFGYFCIVFSSEKLLGLLCQLIGGVSSNSLCFNCDHWEWGAAGSDMGWTLGPGSSRLRLRMTMPIMVGGAPWVTSLPSSPVILRVKHF